MKGNNTLLLNESTLIEAVQEYLDRRTANDFKPVRVTAVRGGNGVERRFEVDVTEQVPAAGEA